MPLPQTAADEATVPNIGILCIDLATQLGEHYGWQWHSYIAASYVKYLEAAGALVVPIWIGRDRAYYEGIMQLVNGVLLPGGAVFIDDAEVGGNSQLSNDCVKSARHIYDLALEKNARGELFPLWGTCLGYQLLLIHAAQSPEVRCDCQPIYCALPLELSKDYGDSFLLKQLPAALAQKMGSTPFACHHHRYCITEANLLRSGLSQDWHILATQSDDAGLRFVTLVEHRSYPFFGCQFHPERAAYEQLFARSDNCKEAHTRSCIEMAQFFAHVFVEKCRSNGNKFGTAESRQRHLICNWQPVFTGRLKSSNWLQCYLFERTADYPEE